MDPAKTIKTTSGGRHAAALRDKRHAKATAETAKTFRSPYDDAEAAARFFQYLAARDYADAGSLVERGLIHAAAYAQERAAGTFAVMKRALNLAGPIMPDGAYMDDATGLDRSALGDA
jgi:hypothetical protein